MLIALVTAKENEDLIEAVLVSSIFRPRLIATALSVASIWSDKYTLCRHLSDGH
jgi:hypothetical protein